MAISFSVLGSGSAGNCTLLSLHAPANGAPPHSPARASHLLIDLGLSPRQTAIRLSTHGLTLQDISHVLVSHFDSDHVNPAWIRPLVRQKVNFTLHVHREHAGAPILDFLPQDRVRFYEQSPDIDHCSAITPIRLAHDVEGTVGFLLDHHGTRMGFATDLGHVPDALLDLFENLHALALESNYDRDMQLASPRPPVLKRRIMGGRGHLSNEQSLNAVLHVARRSPCLQHVAALHLSRQCNTPRLIQTLYARHAGHLLDRLTITAQHAPTAMLHVRPDHPPFADPPEVAVLPGAQLTIF